MSESYNVILEHCSKEQIPRLLSAINIVMIFID